MRINILIAFFACVLFLFVIPFLVFVLLLHNNFTLANQNLAMVVDNDYDSITFAYEPNNRLHMPGFKSNCLDKSCSNQITNNIKLINLDGGTENITTTTLPPTITIQCDQNLFVDQKARCSVSECKRGVWFITNEAGKPLPTPILSDIPPFTIEFVAQAEGSISVNALCFEPYAQAKYIINVEEGVVLTCPDSCLISGACKCEVRNCSYGLFSLVNYNGTPLSEEVFKLISSSTFEFTFRANNSGVVLAKVDCFEPSLLKREAKINIVRQCSGSISLILSSNRTSPSAIVRAFTSGLSNCENKIVYIKKDSCSGIEACTCLANGDCPFIVPSEQGNYTYYACFDKNDDGDFNDEGEIAYANLLVEKTEERFKIENITCSETNCTLTITENTINGNTVIFIQLMGEPTGRVYYSSNLNLEIGSSGKKNAFLSQIATCPSDKKLKVLAIAYKQSDIENRIYRLKADAFTC
ncbi:MAG: hypothetical protein QXQ40_01870 [Candidatus Aenigmatarchaeota archaeon]